MSPAHTMQTPPRSSLIRDALAALADSPDPGVAAQLEGAEARNRERQRRQFDALTRSPGGRGEEAGALDLVSLYGASGRTFVPGQGVQGGSLEMLGGTRSVTAAERMQAGSVQVPASVSLAIGGGGASRSRSYGRRKSYGRSYSRSRSRSGGRVSYYQKRAIARKAYIRGKYPSATYAHPYVVRGSAAAQAMGMTPGVAFKDASAEEQVRRRAVGWYGKGDYMQGMGEYASVPQFTGKTLAGTKINLGNNKEIIRSEVFYNVMTPPVASQQQIQQFEVNIGLDEMFPFGSQIANNYRKYRITQLAFTYKNMLPQSQTTTQVGQVSLTFNPDVGEENDITTNMQVANDQSTVNCNANEDVTLFCEMDPARGAPNQFLNIRNKALRTTQDPSDFDVGVFILTLAGFPVPAAGALPLPFQIGRLSVSYCVELQHEVVNTAMGSSIDSDLFLRPSRNVAVTQDQFWQTSTLIKSENNVGCALVNLATAGGVNPPIGIQFPATAFGYYQIELSVEAPAISVAAVPTSFASTPPFFIGSNGTVGPVFDLLNTSSGTQYSSLTNFSNPCVAPSGAPITAPGDPYCFGNGSWSWDPQFPGPAPVAVGTAWRASCLWHVYVPGISSNSPAALFAGPTSSPIQMTIGFAQNVAYAVGASSEINNSRWSIRITEYNSTFRLKLNGSQDQPYTTNFAGVPTLLTVATW